MKSIPINHHFVPQHFLKEWSIKNKVYQYKIIKHTKKLYCKLISIKSTSSIKNLYSVPFPDMDREFESTLMSSLDNIGYEVIKKIRYSSFEELDSKEKKKLAIYLTCMEARHPKILKKMNIKNELFNILNEIDLKYPGTKSQLFELVTGLSNMPTIGSLSLAAIVSNEFSGKFMSPISQGLENAYVKEFKFKDKILLSSDYPIARFGDYNNEFSLSISISPQKAILYATNPIACFQLDKWPDSIKINIFNLLTLANATRVYTTKNIYFAFVKKYLGWATSLNNKEKREFLSKYIKSLFKNT